MKEFPLQRGLGTARLTGGAVMDIDKTILQAIPVGREHAVGAGSIIEAVGMWSTTAIRKHLADLVASGQVEVATVPTFRGRKVVVYFQARVPPGQPRP